MAIWLSVVLVILGIMNISVGMLAIADGNRDILVNRLFFIVCFTSMVWCIGYALMGIAPGELASYVLRAVALFGVFSCCAAIVFYTQNMSRIFFKYQRAFEVYLISGGLFSYVAVAMPQAVTFTMTPYGRYYVSNQWIGRYIQYVYLASLFAVCLHIAFKWWKGTKYKREKRMARYLVVSSVVITLGAFFDAVFPLFGMTAFPSSAITTFIYIQLLFMGLRQYNATVIATASVSRTIFKTIATPVVIIGDRMEVIECNEKACEYLGGTMEELMDAHYFDWIRFTKPDEAERIRIDLMNLTEEIEFQAYIRSSGDSCTIVATPIYDRFGELLCLICMLNDNTKYENIRKAADMAEHRAEMSEAVEKAFIRRVNDKLRTPIQETVAYLDSIKDRLDSLTSYDAEHIRFLCIDNVRLLDKIDELLDISRIEAGGFELENHKFDLESLMLEVIAEAGEMIDESKLRLITRISPKVPRIIIGDRKRLKYVLGVILANAVRFTEQGRIMLQLSANVSFGVVKLMFSISDTGLGIEERELDYLFGIPDENGGKISEGAGLSLSACSKIVKLMDGKIKVRSSPGMGTTFSFDVNMTTDDEQGIVPYGEYKQKVMIIMDDQFKTEAMAHTLRELGIECDTMIRERIENTNLSEDDSVTLVLVGAGIMSRMKAYLKQAYRYADFVPVYSYKNYNRLEKGAEGICESFIFSQIRDVLRTRS